MTITSWSYSKLTDFERCKFACWLKHDQKVPEPERPLPAGKTEHANDRGTRIHDNCEGYVRGDHDALCPEAEKHFGVHLDLLRHQYSLGMVSLEGEWGMDSDWNIAEWKGAWLRLKLDAMLTVDKTHAIIIDYKSGRKFGNEIKHSEQVKLYAITAFHRFPDLNHITTQLWYIDQPPGSNLMSMDFEREKCLKQFFKGFDHRGRSLVDNTKWPANPNKFSCQWCLYGPNHSGHCQVGVRPP